MQGVQKKTRILLLPLPLSIFTFKLKFSEKCKIKRNLKSVTVNSVKISLPKANISPAFLKPI